MKYKNMIIKGKSYVDYANDNKCMYCNGTGYYDDYNVSANKPYYCDACNGSGKKNN